MRASSKIGLFALAALSCALVSLQARAFSASSTDFYVYQEIVPSSGGNPSSSFSTSTGLEEIGAAGEAVVGTSTSADFGLYDGFMANLFSGPAPTYEQIHYHWRNDNGSESGATSATGGVQDTALSAISAGTIIRLRVEVANHGGTTLNYSSQQFKIQYGLLSSTCGAISSWSSLGAGAAWNVANSGNLTNGANTTNIAISAGGVTDTNHAFLTPNGGVVDNTDTAGAVSVASDSFIELEYALTPTATASNGATYCFRVTNAGATTDYLYTIYPQATISGGSLTFITDSNSEILPTVSPGTLVATSSILYVNTSNADGFSVSVIRANATSTMMLSGSSATGLPDKLAWVPGGTCSSAGNATASTTNPNTLEFRVRSAGTTSGNYCSSWWGTNDTTTSALFAGFPTTTQPIVDRTTSSSPTTTASVLYNLNVPVTQQTGAYSGSVTYTATANP